MSFIVIKDETGKNSKTLPLTKQRYTVGSSENADIRIKGERISGLHALIECSVDVGAGSDAGARITVYDLASETGIRLNGQSVIQSQVKTGDVLHIGAFEIVFSAKNTDPKQNDRSTGDKQFSLIDSSLDNPNGDLVPNDLFDHANERFQAMQIVMFYNDVIMDVKHFQKEKRVLLGPTKKDDFPVPTLLTTAGESKGRFELMSNQSGSFSLHLDKAMTGVIARNGQLKSLREVSESVGNSAFVALESKDFAKVNIGDLSFYFSYCPGIPKLKPSKLTERDPLFFRIWFISLLVTCLTVLTLTKLTVDPSIEIEQLPERIATVIYKPELLPIEKPPVPQQKELVETKPKEELPKEKKVIKITPKQVDLTKPAPKNAMIGEEAKKSASKAAVATSKANARPGPKANMAGNEGEGAKAKGPEGQRGKPDSNRSGVAQTKATRPGEGPKGAPAVARQGHSQVQDLGIVDVFKDSKGLLDKVMAGGKGVSGAADKIEGYGGFTTKGAGGLGETGAGSGGGGQSEGLGGLSDKGVGGGKRGKGLGALGTGGNIIGGSGRLVVAGGNGAPEAVVLGAIDSDAIAREIAKHRDEIKYCYEKEINAENPDLSGRISIKWTIGASGAVSQAGVQSTTLKNALVEQCVVDVIKRIVFPPVKGGGVAEVTYPFVFRPSR